ncbi:MAG: hypothetical protein JWN24_3686 [Phycisphaerales bacterium]|nr:hypothetical protein [Phycisphaerales bacterium]
MQSHTSRRRGRAGFTLVELLVVVGIIIILISILLPVVATMQRKSRETDTSALINKLATAAQNYYNDFRNYPGPVPDSRISGYGPPPPGPLNITGITTLTSSENFLLALLGGLTAKSNAPNPPTISYDPTFVGKGPQSLNPLTPKQTSAYVDFTASDITPKDATGNYATYNSIAIGSPPTVPDSVVPEFFDHFSTPRPLIILRARVGARTIVDTIPGPNGVVDPQYYSAEMLPYGFNFPTANEPDTGMPKYTAAVQFFQHPTINDQRTPRNKDTFIIMSAGVDGIWGTKDDIIYSN